MVDQSDNDAVGYRRPPRNRQFQKGSSGNPRGRPKKDVEPFTGRRFRRDILSMLDEPTEVKVGGKLVRMPLFLAYTRGQLIAAAQGKRKVDLGPLLLQLQLVSEQERSIPDLKRRIEYIEEDLRSRDSNTPEAKYILNYLNKLRRQTRE